MGQVFHLERSRTTLFPSGIHFVGDVPSHWKSVKFNTVFQRYSHKNRPDLPLFGVSKKYGVIRKDPENTLGPRPSEDLSPYSVAYKGSLVVNKMQAWQGALGIAKDDAIVSPAYFTYVKTSDSFNDDYLEFLLRSSPYYGQYYCISCGVRTDQWDLNATLFQKTMILLPPYNEQKQIGKFIVEATNTVDEFIENLSSRISTLTEIKSDWQDRIVQGEDNSNWEEMSNGSLFTQRDTRGRPELPLLHVSLRTGVTVRKLSDRKVEQISSDFSTQKVAMKNDIAFNKMRMWQGAVGVAPCDGLVSTDYTVACPREGVHPEYFMHLFRTSQYRTEINRWSHGIVPDRNRLYWEQFKAMKSLVPPYEEQIEIVKKIRAVNARFDALSSCITTLIERLKEYRTALITATVTGQIEVGGEA